MHRLQKIALLLSCAVVIFGCASPSPLVPAPARPLELEPPQLAPAPAQVMVKREPNFLSRLLNFLSDSPARPMKSSTN